MDKRGLVFALLTVFLWATLGAGLKLAVSRQDSFVVCVYIGFFATLALLIWLFIKGKASKIYAEFMKHPWFFILTGIIGLCLQQVFYLKGYQLLPASQVVIIFYLYPLLMVLLSWLFFKEHTSWKSVFFILIGFSGVYVLISKGTLLTIDLSLGVIVTLLAALSWALFSVLIKQKKFDIDVGMFLFNLFGFLSLVAIIPFFSFTLSVTFSEVLGMIYLAVFPTAIAFVLWNNALRALKTSICSNIALLTPLLSIIIIFLVLKEQIVMFQVIGLLLIVGSVFLTLNFGEN